MPEAGTGTGNQRSAIAVVRAPTELNAFVGREREYAALREAVAEHRFVLVAGPSGIGKSRLVLRMIPELRRPYRDGVAVVEAAGLEERHELVAAIGAALGVPDATTEEALLARIGTRSLVVVIDDADGAGLALGEVVERLVRGCPAVRVIVTARHATRIAGERMFGLAPLEHSGGAERLGDAGRSEAHALLATRLSEQGSALIVDSRNSADIDEVIALTEGVPRAIEATARALRVLRPADLAAQLALPEFELERFGVDGHWGRSTEAAFRRGVDSLRERDRALLLQLGVFRGAFDLEFAAEVLGLGSAGLIGGAIDELLNRSLVIREDGPDRVARFRIPAHYRRLVRLALAETADGTLAAVRLRIGLLRRLDRAGQTWYSDAQLSSVQFLTRYVADVRALLDELAATPAEAGEAVRIINGLRFYWQLHPVDPWPRARDWLDAALTAGAVAGIDQLRALHTDAYIAFMESDIPGAREQLARATELARALPAEPRDALFEEFMRGVLELVERHDAEAERCFRRVIAQSHQVRLEHQIGERFWFLALGLLLQDRLPEAELAVADGIALCERTGDAWGRASMRWLRALIRLRAGGEDEAGELLQQCLADFVRFQDRTSQALCIQLMTKIAALRGDDATVVRFTELLSGLAPLFPSMPIEEIRPVEVDEARSRMSGAALRRITRSTRTRALPEVISAVLSGQEIPGEAPVADPSQLSPRESEIAELIAVGLGNPAIAARLFISRRTVEGHVQRILGKLGFRSRSQVAVWVAEQWHDGAAAEARAGVEA